MTYLHIFLLVFIFVNYVDGLLHFAQNQVAMAIIGLQNEGQSLRLPPRVGKKSLGSLHVAGP